MQSHNRHNKRKFVSPTLVLLLLCQLASIELQLGALEDVPVSTSVLPRARRDARQETSAGELVLQPGLHVAGLSDALRVQALAALRQLGIQALGECKKRRGHRPQTNNGDVVLWRRRCILVASKTQMGESTEGQISRRNPFLSKKPLSGAEGARRT